MLSHRRFAAAPAPVAWRHLARPRLWHTWAPHLRGAWGLGSPEVEPGRIGAVRLLGIVPVPVRITDRDPGRSWTWRAGPYLMEHRVEPKPGGCDVVIDVTATPALERAMDATYSRLINLLLSRLVDTAEKADELSSRVRYADSKRQLS